MAELIKYEIKWDGSLYGEVVILNPLSIMAISSSGGGINQSPNQWQIHLDGGAIVGVSDKMKDLIEKDWREKAE